MKLLIVTTNILVAGAEYTDEGKLVRSAPILFKHTKNKTLQEAINHFSKWKNVSVGLSAECDL